ncbi:hypothetical protein [Limnofasciculus baicalensis]|uniref:Tetratricopeptide repeat protein n=1 Tax=Limnofasciculus baicalensis BBK-W-15 TaxID=2699891 RepID=A0AAE3GN10_9CYAN|nr:hypothetical protein [Limnofasciculus baicalensis]MCP2726879.1 hypothetical protein [Limnofasciculus baicalensis BBK-W-15]
MLSNFAKNTILLSLILSQSINLSVLANPIAIERSSFCREAQQQQAFTRWNEFGEWFRPVSETKTEVPTFILTELLQELDAAGKERQLIQLAIDRLSVTGVGFDELKAQPLLNLIERTPTSQRDRILPILERMVSLSQSLGKGYNQTQTRSLITAAQAYQRLGKRDLAISLLAQAEQILPGIRGAQLLSEGELRLAEGWFAVAQTAKGVTVLERAKSQIISLYSQGQNNNPFLAETLIGYYIQNKQINKAQQFAQQIPSAWDSSNQLIRVAVAYHKNQEPQIARQIFERSVQKLVSARKPENPTDILIAKNTIKFAQLGELTTAASAAQKILAENPHWRAQAWLTIAGEARKRNQSQLATQAMNQMIAAGNLGKKYNFGMGFGDQRDYEWSQELYPLSRQNGYESEMVQFIERMNLQAEGAEFLIEQALKRKEFDKAKKLIPIPMSRSIDAGVFEVQDVWLEKVATQAARAGQFSQAVALSQAQPENILLLVRLSQAIEDGGNSKEAQQLLEIALQKAAKLDVQSGSLSTLIGAAQLLEEKGESQAAERFIQILQTQLQGISNPKQRVERLEKIYQEGGWGNLDTNIEIIKRLGVPISPAIAQMIINQSIAQNRPDVAEKFLSFLDSPLAKFDPLIRLGDIYLSQRNSAKAKIFFDLALEIAPQIKTDANLFPTWWNSLPNAYLKLGEIEKARQAARSIDRVDQRELALKRLACF